MYMGNIPSISDVNYDSQQQHKVLAIMIDIIPTTMENVATCTIGRVSLLSIS